MVTFGDGVVWVVGALGTAKDMLPPRSNLCPSRNGNHGTRYWIVKTSIASYVSRVDVLHWIITIGGTDTNELTLISTID